MRITFVILGVAVILLAACTSVDLNAFLPTFETGVDSDAWVKIPAGEFLQGQFAKPAAIDYEYEIMVTNVTNVQFAEFINQAFQDGTIGFEGINPVGFYPGDVFHGAKHEEEIVEGWYVLVTLDDPSARISFDRSIATPQTGYENHPVTLVSWFGAQAYCQYYGWRLPSEMEWEKAARGSTDDRPFPWGEEIKRENANFYASRDPFENMSSFGSRTSPVGFYNGQIYGDYQTIDSPSPYGLYDMAGNVWQWTGDVYEGMHYRFLRGGSKDTYEMDLRIWVRNNATPTYVSPGVGFRCAR